MWLKLKLVLAAAVPMAIGGCIHDTVDVSTPSFEVLTSLRSNGVPQIALGRFAIAPGRAGMFRTVNIRGSSVHAPKGQTFADTLKQAFQTELVAAGKLDAKAPVQMSATLLESQGSENFSKGQASLAAEISVVRGQGREFRKTYRVETGWQSDFIGAIAIPEALREYNALYPLLVRKALTDPELLSFLKQ